MKRFWLSEVMIVSLVALFLFGPKKLPEVSAAFGKSIKAFCKGILY